MRLKFLSAFAPLGRLFVSPLLLLGLLCSVGSSAEVVKGMYNEEVLVASQRTAERQKALTEALQRVIIRVSGRPSILESDEVRAAIAAPQPYLESFHYRSTDQEIDYQGVPVNASMLMLNFAEAAVKRLLRQNSLPLWPENRPSVLIWLVKDDVQMGRQLQSVQDDSAVAQAIQNATKRRGLPVVSPVLDLQDQMLLNADQAWQLDAEAIYAASARYQADVILVGRYSQLSSGKWLSTWSLFREGRQEVYESQAAEEADMVDTAIDLTATSLAERYAIHLGGESSGQLVMQLRDLETFTDYVDAISYLDDLAIVRRVERMAIQGTTLWLVLHTEESAERLLGTLALGKKLQPATSDSLNVAIGALGSRENPLRYRWPQRLN